MKLGKQLWLSVVAFVLTLAMILPFASQRAQAAAFDPQTGQENLSLRFWNDEKPDNGFYLNATARHMLQTVKEPSFGTGAGEWSVMDLARGMYTGYDYLNYIPANYFTDYKARIDATVDSLDGELHTAKSTEWSRLTLAMSALGYDIRQMGSKGQYDFVDRLAQSHAFSYKQGINGPIWELLALNTGHYTMPEKPSKYTSEADINTAGKMIDYIMNLEITQANGVVGGWALSGKKPDPDITGMAIHGLAQYYTGDIAYPSDAKTSFTEFKKAIERAVYQLAAIQESNGGYGSWGSINSESTVQVIVALTALNMDPMSKAISLPTINKVAKFNKSGDTRDGVYTDNMMDALYTFWAWGSGSSPEVGGFKHVTTGYDGGGGSGTGVNGMATDQALYGIIAYDRYLNNQKSLYNMTDQINGEYKTMQARHVDVTLNEGGRQATVKQSPYAAYEIPAVTTTNEKVVSWNTKQDGTGVSYFPGELLSIPDHAITLYAQFDSKTFTIDYKLDGGAFTDNTYSTTYKNTEEIALPLAKQLKKEGHQFVGWYDNANLTGAAITVIPKGSGANKVFYAKWVNQNELVAEVMKQIAALPTTIVVDNKMQIDNVRTMYDALSATEKTKVTNYNKLLDAEQQLKLALASNNLATTDAELSEAVVSFIQTIPAEKDVTLTSQSVIQDARTAYDKLTIAQKRTVYNYQLLVRAEKKLASIVAVEVDGKMAEPVSEQIKALPKVVTPADSEKIEMARVAYDVLTAKQQELVTNYNVLVQRETALKVALNDAALQVTALKNNATKITGTTTPKTKLTAYVDGEKIGATTATSEGDFSIKIAKIPAGKKVVIKATGALLATKTITVKTSKTLVTPTVNFVKTTHTKVTGKASKTTTVSVYDKKDKRLGTAKVKADGTFSAKIAKQKKGMALYVQSKDSMNNVSKKVKVVVQATKTLAAPTVNPVKSSHTKVTGKASKTTTVTVFNAKEKALGKAKVASNRAYSVKIAKQKKGTVLYVQSQDSIENVSKKVKVTVK